MSSTMKTRAAALKVQHAVEHHARDLAPLKQALQDALDFSGIMHRVYSQKGGANSNVIELADGRTFYVRGRTEGRPPFIAVREQGVTPKRWTQLFNGRDALRWVKSL